MEKSGWYYKHDWLSQEYEWGIIKVQNPKLGRITQIQYGKLNNICFRVITIDTLGSVLPIQRMALSDYEYRELILLKNEITARTDIINEVLGCNITINEENFIVIIHELQHICDDSKYRNLDWSYLETRAILRTLTNENINPYFAIVNFAGWKVEKEDIYRNAYILILKHLQVSDIETLIRLSPDEIRKRAKKGLIQSTYKLIHK